MGLSGSGKSTLLRAVNGLNPVTRGRCWCMMARPTSMWPVAGQKLRGLRTGRIAMVFQQFGLLPWRTVAENVGFGLELAGVPRADRDGRVAEQLSLVHLEEWGDRQGP